MERVAALGLGTYGALIFKPRNPASKEVCQTASLYHLVHTAAFLAAPITTLPNVFGSLLTAGILAFSGTCCTVALLEDRKYATLAPFGGFAFIAAWASFFFLRIGLAEIVSNLTLLHCLYHSSMLWDLRSAHFCLYGHIDLGIVLFNKLINVVDSLSLKARKKHALSFYFDLWRDIIVWFNFPVSF